MCVGHYLSKVRGLMNLKRYQNLFLFKQRSVAEHSWSVAKIAQALAITEMKEFGKEVNMGFLLEKAISHDELELITGDILSHTKRRTKAMRRAVEGLERKVFDTEYSEEILPEGWKEHFRNLTLDAKDGTIEGDILAAADVIDTIFEASDEIRLGNRDYFEEVYLKSVEKLKESKLGSVQKFLTQDIQGLGIDIDIDNPLSA